MTEVRKSATATMRAKCIAAARALFEGSGDDAMGLGEVASTADLSTCALFSNFATKAQLYREIYGHAPISIEAGRLLLAALHASRHALSVCAPPCLDRDEALRAIDDALDYVVAAPCRGRASSESSSTPRASRLAGERRPSDAAPMSEFWSDANVR